MTKEPNPSRDAMDYAEQSVRGSGTSFYWAMRVLDRDKRQAMYALYAFCREVDDIVDEPGPLDQKIVQLNSWRVEIDTVFQHDLNTHSRKQLSPALVTAIDRFQLQPLDFIAIIDGMESDARTSVRMNSMDDLHLYIDQVACTVGRLSTSIFGIPDPVGDNLAKSLGEALQLTNILRDVEEDSANNRLYLPAELLAEFGVHCGLDDDVPAILNHPGVTKTCQKLQQLAEMRFGEAREYLSLCSHKQARPVLMMLVVYERLLSKLTNRGWSFPCKAMSLSKIEKIWILLRYGFL